MRSLIRQAVALFLLAAGVAAVDGAGEDKKEQPLSPETVLEKEIQGKATVEFLVEGVTTLNIDSLYVPDVSHAQIIKAKVPGAREGREFWVVVSRETATRLLHLGVEDPAKHFRGKQMRVSGTIERFSPTEEPARMIYKIRVTDLAQLEHVKTP